MTIAYKRTCRSRCLEGEFVCLFKLINDKKNNGNLKICWAHVFAWVFRGFSAKLLLSQTMFFFYFLLAVYLDFGIGCLQHSKKTVHYHNAVHRRENVVGVERQSQCLYIYAPFVPSRKSLWGIQWAIERVYSITALKWLCKQRRKSCWFTFTSTWQSKWAWWA